MTGPGVVVVGGSLAGIHVAEALRAEGWTGALTVVDADTEPHFDRPPMSKNYLGGSVDAVRLLLRDRERLDALGVTWQLGNAATGLDTAGRVLRLADGRELPYETLVVATGVNPVFPAGLAVPSAHTLRNKRDADALRSYLRPDARLVVIGAGFIGLEVASTFREVGASVEVIEALPTPLHRQLGPVVGAAVQRRHEANGVTFHLGRQATQVEEVDGIVSVQLDDGTVVRADALLVAVGSRPVTGWLEGSGLALDGGLLVDEHLLAAPGVYAVGDVARWPHPLIGRLVRIEHWTNAIEQGKYVARRIVGAEVAQQPFAALPYFWSDQCGRRIQAHGFPSQDSDVEVFDGDLDGDRFAAFYRTAGRITAVVGMNNPRQVIAGRRRVIEELSLEEMAS